MESTKEIIAKQKLREALKELEKKVVKSLWENY